MMILQKICVFFLYCELMDENEREKKSEKQKKLIFEGRDISENKLIFKNGKKNNKYIYLEIFSNVLFHSTSVIQSYIYEIITKKNSKFLDLIWLELLQNLTFVYNRVRQDKLWKEFFIRTILFFKFHQYLCEEDNKEFKKKFNIEKLKITSNKQKNQNIILIKFFWRCD